VKRFIPLAGVFLLACQLLTPLAGTQLHTHPVAAIRATSRSENNPIRESYPDPVAQQTGWDNSSGISQPNPSAFAVRLHPDGPLYIGDQVSIEVIAPQGVDLEESDVQVSVKQAGIGELGSAPFGEFGIGGRYQATLSWVWDTEGLTPGSYSLSFDVQPEVANWSMEVLLLPASGQPPPEPQARWETVAIECCLIHYISGTAAARDISELLEVAQTQADAASQSLENEFSDPIEITILPRVLGHGGFASNEIHVSYLDRNYTNSNFSQVLEHEMVHILDSRLGGELRPSLFVEGLAVYLSGGHYKKEPLISRAAGLFELGWYIPLEPLADDFYNAQHEVGYLEAGALIQYMVRTWGWGAFSDFYRDIHPHEGGRQSQAIDAALQAHFGLTFEQLEQRFVNELRSQHINPDLYDEVRLVVSYYETVRRYQQVLDPSAYFLTAWLPEGSEMRKRNLVADYLRRPSSLDNITLEKGIILAGAQIQTGDFNKAQKILSIINQTLDEYEQVDQSLTLPQGW